MEQKNLKADDGHITHPVTIEGIEGKDKAIEAIEKSIKLYKDKFIK